MLDAVAMDGVALAAEGELDGVDGFADGLVADGVDGELEAFGLGIAGLVLEVFGIVDADAARGGFVGVGSARSAV